MHVQRWPIWCGRLGAIACTGDGEFIALKILAREVYGWLQQSMTPLDAVQKAQRIDWLIHPVSRFLKIEAAAGAVLLMATLLALYLANSSYSEIFSRLWHISIGVNIGSFEFERSLHAWINDAVMTFFSF